MNLRIQGGRVIDPANNIDQLLDIYIANDKIVALDTPPIGFRPDQSINARGRVVCPGFVDLCARLREPGLEYKGTIASETRAASAGGVTTLCCPPDTDPIVDTPAVSRLIQSRAKAGGQAWVLPIGALTRRLKGEQLSEMAALKSSGCIGVSNALKPIPNTQVMRLAMEYATTFQLTLFVHPAEAWLSNNGCVHEGPVATRLGLPGIPVAAETTEIARVLSLVEEVGARVHFRHLSSERGVHMIQAGLEKGLPISAEVSAHQLHLTEADIHQFDSQCHLVPPVRSMRDRDALRAALKNGVIQAICSDHQPHEPDAKLAPFEQTEPGISALETLLPLTLELVRAKTLTLSQAISRLTCDPAKILRIEAGTLSVGARADICIFDPDQPWIVSPETVFSQGKNTPFMGRTLNGQVTHTLFNGDLVHTL